MWDDDPKDLETMAAASTVRGIEFSAPRPRFDSRGGGKGRLEIVLLNVILPDWTAIRSASSSGSCYYQKPFQIVLLSASWRSRT
jgi:hypothetical protein